MDPAVPLSAFFTVFLAIFIAELTDKDALLLLTLATKSNPWLVFLAGSVAFTLTSAVIVTVGSALVLVVPVSWIKAAGGVIMLGYAAWTFTRGGVGSSEGEEKKLLGQRRGELSWLALAILSLMLLDLAGDATELLTVVFVAQFKDLLLVFGGAVAALILASGLETILGNRLGRVLTASTLRLVSVFVFFVIGASILLSVATG